MKQLLLVPVGALVLCVGIYYVAFAESAAYSAFEEFDMHRLKFRFDDAEKLVSSDQVREYLEEFRAGGYTMSRLNAGPYRKLESESTMSDGRVRLSVVQELGRGPGSAPGTLGTVNLKEHIVATMRQTDDGWKVDEFRVKNEWLDERTEDW